jgi:ATP-binding cassette subfamily C protein
MIINVDRLTRNRDRSIIGAILDPFSIVPLSHRLIVTVGLFFSSVMEMLGLAIIIPLLSAVSFGDDTSGMSASKAGISHAFHSALASIGLSPNIATLVFLIVIGLSIKSAISIAVMRHVGDLMADITTSVRMAIIRALLNANWPFFSGQPLGRLVNGTGSESNAVGESFLCSATLIAVMLQVAAYGVISAVISWKLSILALVIGLVMLVTFGQLVRQTKQAAKQHSRQLRELASSFTDSILGMKPIKAMGRQARFASLFEADARKLHVAMRTKVVSGEFASEFQEPLIAALLCTGLYIATSEWHLKLHQQVVVGLLLIRLISSLSMAQRTYQRLVSLQDMYNSVGNLLKTAAAAKEVYLGTTPPTFQHGVDFKGVSFGYSTEDQILQKVDWHLPIGKISALIGVSGAGKSTIVDLVMGLRQPAQGSVTVDNIDLTDIDITQWRHMIGYVPQEVTLFNDTIYNNVTLGEPDFSEADVVDALTAAGAMSFIKLLPERLDYPVGERGHRLSGGQRQRIAIARALVRRPALLVLDEATTGLDKEVEKEICTAIRDIVEQRKITVLAISHQAIWATIADEIFLLQRRTVTRQDDVDAPQDSPTDAVSTYSARA